MAVRSLEVVLSVNVGPMRQGLRAASGDVRGLTNDFNQAGTRAGYSGAQMLKFGAATLGVAQGVRLLSDGLRTALTDSLAFETSMRNVNSISKQSEAAFQAQSEAVLNLSTRLPQSAQELADGLYDIASSGFQGAEGLKVLEVSARAASAGLATTAESARAITAVMNAYGLTANDAADISDVLFQTVNLGVVSFSELASQVGDVVGIAAAAKVPIGDVGAALAAMTLSGLSAAESSTALNRVIQSIIDPSDALAAVLKLVGYESGTAALSTDGLYGVMEKLRQTTGGNVDAMLALFPEVRAAKGAFALAANEGRNFSRSMDEIASPAARVQATMKALQEQAKSEAFQLKLAGNEAKATGIRFGRELLPPLVDAVQQSAHLAGVALPAVAGALKVLTVLIGPAVGLGVLKLGALAWGLVTAAATRATAAVSTFGLATTVATAGLNVLLTVVASGLLSALDKSSSKADQLAESLAGIVDSFDPSEAGAEEVFGALQDRIDETETKIDQLSHGVIGFGRSMVDGFLPGRQELEKLIAEHDRLEDHLDEQRKQHYAIRLNIGAIADELGIAYEQAVALAKASGVDLTASLESSGPARDKVIKFYEEQYRQLGYTKAEFERVFGTALPDAVEKAQKELDDLKDKIGDVFASATDAIGSFELVTAEDSTKRVTSAKNELQDARIALHELAISSRKDGVRSIGDAHALRRAKERVTEAEKAYKKAQDESLSSGEQLRKHYRDQLEEAQKFADGLKRAAAKGLDPKVILELLTAGPEKAGPYLEALLSDQSGTLIGFVNDTTSQITRLGDEVTSFLQPVLKASRDPLLALPKDLAEAMTAAAEAVKAGSSAHVDAIAALLDSSREHVLDIARAYGLTIGAEVINGIAQAALYTPAGHVRQPGEKPIGSGMGLADGAIVNMASGGLQAHIAPGTAIMYAEPGTGGEAFIPMGLNKRARSLALMHQVAQAFGGQFIHMANGGVRGGAFSQTNTHSLRNEYHFNGDIRVQDMAASERYARSKRRSAAVTGRVA